MSEDKKLTLEQLNEVNARVKEVIETFREGLCNSSVFDYGNYWRLGASNDKEQRDMGEACKYVYDTKKRIVSMIDKELMLVENNNNELYYKEKRKAKQIIIDKLMGFITPYLKGRTRDEHHILQRVVNLTEFAIESGEDLNKFSTRGKFTTK